MLILALGVNTKAQIHRMAPGASSWSPDQVLHLAKWTLTLRVSDSTGEKEALQTLGSDTLTKGYTSNYFYAGNDAGVFICPRCALSEVPGAYFDIHTASRLSVTLSVAQLPDGNAPVTVGQIRGLDAGALVQLIYTFDPPSRSGKLSARVSSATATVAGAGAGPGSATSAVAGPGAGQKDYVLATHIPLNWKFSYVLEMGLKGQIQVSMPGTAPLQIPVDPSWQGKQLYFQVGNDVLGTASIDDGAILFMYTLKAEHHL